MAALSMGEGVVAGGVAAALSTEGGARAASGVDVGCAIGVVVGAWAWIWPSPISPTICALVRPRHVRRVRARMVLVESNIMMC